ncbi:hypothetical protein D3C77_458630 [compost metagenome]
MDAIHFKVKQDGAIVHRAAYMVMVIGIDLDGTKICWVSGLARMNLASSGLAY